MQTSIPRFSLKALFVVVTICAVFALVARIVVHEYLSYVDQALGYERLVRTKASYEFEDVLAWRIDLVDLHGSTATQDDITDIMRCRFIEVLGLGKGQFSTETCKAIRSQSRLKMLCIYDAEISSFDVQQLEALTRLESLDLWECSITEHTLDQMCCLPNMQDINISGGTLPVDAIDRVARQHPGVIIRHFPLLDSATPHHSGQ